MLHWNENKSSLQKVASHAFCRTDQAYSSYQVRLVNHTLIDLFHKQNDFNKNKPNNHGQILFDNGLK